MSKLFITITLLSFVAVLLRAEQKPMVVATASIFADMADNIGGGEVEVRTIVPIGGDPHLHEPTPADAILVKSADLILKNGLTFEGWLNELIDNSGTKAKIKLITEGIAPIESSKYANSTDPHAWMSAANGLYYLHNIKDALCHLVPDKREIFEFNHGIYVQQLEDLHAEILRKIESIPEQRRILITSHDAFRYFGNEYGIRVESILGTSTDAEIQTSDIIRLNSIIKSSGIPAVFIESTVDPKVLQQLAQDNDIEIGGKLYSDSIGDQDSPAPTYIEMLRYNTNTIVTALTAIRKELTTVDSADDSGGNSLLFGLALGILLLGGFVVVFRNLK